MAFMLSMKEAILLLREHDITADELMLKRWIRERRIIAVRTAENHSWHFPEESLIFLILEELRNESARLRDLLNQKMQSYEEPPF